MFQKQYYTLFASLPPLPYFERAVHLPINEVRLRDRMKMLEPEDVEIMQKTLTFVGWQMQPLERTDVDVAKIYDEMLKSATSYPILKAMVSKVMDQRTILVALRRRHLDMPVPLKGEAWGVGQWVDHIRRNWKHVDLQLGLEYPWIPKAREFIETDQALELEKLIMKQNWKTADDYMAEHPFTFETILFYVSKWIAIKNWLTFSADAARERFDNYITEVIDRYEQHSS